ncbi:MAG TPA: hypothetical protein PK006_08100 [Saprospiraceae bacterium]|nr:hypothetical protein [Saprospiraceae bacterium]
MENSSDIVIGIYDLQGHKVCRLLSDHLHSGFHQVIFNPKSCGLPNASYMAQLEVSNANGVLKEAKMMTYLQ